MSRGKYQKPAMGVKKYNKTGVLLASLVLIFVLAIGTTVAYIIDVTSQVKNTFTPAKVEITVNEDKTATQKTNISFTNTKIDEAVPVYIRATLVIYWTDTVNGTEQVIAPPADASVDVPNAPINEWFQVKDIYYYPEAVDPGDSTKDMLDTITVTVPNGSTAKCYIDIQAEAIQAEPTGAVEDAWKDVDVSDGKLVPAGTAVG